MSQQSTIPTRTGVVIAAAAAALTLAAGVTVGSLLGWVGPDRAAPPAPPAEASPSDPAPPAPAVADAETTFASRERGHHGRRDRHGRERRHHEERHDDD